jgi:septal ring factor EnvC (AmiA/AmiB activator)
MTVATSDIQRAREALAGLESRLSDALDRRGKTVDKISRACAEAETARGINSARNSLGPLNKRAGAIDSEIALLRINISHARRRVELVEAHAESVKAKQATDRGETGRLVQLEIRAPDGRVIRQFHRSVDAARKALQPGYEVTGEVIGSGVVSPVGPGARSFMKALLESQGDVLMEWLEARGIVGSDKQTVVVLPSNGREKMQ